MHHAAAGDELEIKQEIQELIVPILAVGLRGFDRRKSFRNPAPHVHRTLLVRGKIFRTQDIGGKFVVTVIVACVECQVHDMRIHAGGDLSFFGTCEGGGSGGSLLVSHASFPSCLI